MPIHISNFKFLPLDPEQTRGCISALQRLDFDIVFRVFILIICVPCLDCLFRVNFDYFCTVFCLFIFHFDYLCTMFRVFIWNLS